MLLTLLILILILFLGIVFLFGYSLSLTRSIARLQLENKVMIQAIIAFIQAKTMYKDNELDDIFSKFLKDQYTDIAEDVEKQSKEELNDTLERDFEFLNKIKDDEVIN